MSPAASRVVFQVAGRGLAASIVFAYWFIMRALCRYVVTRWEHEMGGYHETWIRVAYRIVDVGAIIIIVAGTTIAWRLYHGLPIPNF